MTWVLHPPRNSGIDLQYHGLYHDLFLYWRFCIDCADGWWWCSNSRILHVKQEYVALDEEGERQDIVSSSTEVCTIGWVRFKGACCIHCFADNSVVALSSLSSFLENFENFWNFFWWKFLENIFLLGAFDTLSVEKRITFWETFCTKFFENFAASNAQVLDRMLGKHSNPPREGRTPTSLTEHFWEKLNEYAALPFC